MESKTFSNTLLVSILINNYNYGAFLGEAIDSALNQTYANTEIIVVDDGSSDSSRGIIASYGSRIKPVLKENGGQASAFNAGFAACQGNIIFFLDSDDVFYPNKVQEILNIFTSKMIDGSYIMVHHLLECVDSNGESIGLQIPEYDIHDVPTNFYEYTCQYKFFPYAAGPTSGIAISRELAKLIFPIPEKGVRTSADEFIVRPALLLGEVYGVNFVFAKYRIHGKNNWHGNQKTKTKEFAILLEKYINAKLQENDKEPVVSFFNSVYARNYYIVYGSSQDLFRLLRKFHTWPESYKNMRFLLETTLWAIALPFKSGVKKWAWRSQKL